MQEERYSRNLEERVTRYEERLEEVRRDVSKLTDSFTNFKENHFEHFKSYTYGLLIANLTAVILLLLRMVSE